MSNRVKMKSAKDLLKKAARPERVVKLLLRGDLIARHEELEKQLDEYRRELGFGYAKHDEAVHLAEQIQELELEAEDATLHLRLRALDNTTWRKAVLAHPDPDDKDATDLDAVIESVLPESIVEVRAGKDGDPETMDADDVTDLLAAITHAQRTNLFQIVMTLNGSDNSVPFSQIGSVIRRTSGTESKQPDDTESVSDDTKVGNPEQ